MGAGECASVLGSRGVLLGSQSLPVFSFLDFSYSFKGYWLDVEINPPVGNSLEIDIAIGFPQCIVALSNPCLRRDGSRMSVSVPSMLFGWFRKRGVDEERMGEGDGTF